MQGNFCYSNPTRLFFGDKSMEMLAGELAQYGPKVMMCYGGGSIKRNGVYDKVCEALAKAGKTVVEDAGVMPNPTLTKLMEGARMARENAVDLILAVGGGSVCDYAKGVAASAYCETDPWETYYEGQKSPVCRVLPVGCVLTMVGTGSEMNGGSVITNEAKRLKIGKVFGDNLMPRFTILNPEFTFTVPRYQMVAGFFDIMSHIMEQYFSGADDNTSDYIAEGLMRSLVNSSLVAVDNPKDYEARSNIMWTATWALNTLIGMGKAQDWNVHMIGQSVGAFTNATHGMTLAAVSLPYYRHILDGGLKKFCRFAVNVWGVSAEGKTDRAVAEEGLAALEAWMRRLGLVMSIKELGATPDMFDGIAQGSFIRNGGYGAPSKDEVKDILIESYEF